MEFLVVIACWTAWVIICVNLAKSKGRDTNLAIAAALLCGIFAVIYYLVIPDANS